MAVADFWDLSCYGASPSPNDVASRTERILPGKIHQKKARPSTRIASTNDDFWFCENSSSMPQNFCPKMGQGEGGTPFQTYLSTSLALRAYREVFEVIVCQGSVSLSP
jgi:hypothetical protein